jgi:hypothetical protein
MQQKISALLPLSIMVLALSAVGCASQEKKPVNVQHVAATKPVAATPKAQVAPAPAHIIEQHALDRLKQMSDGLIAAKAFTYKSNGIVEMLADTGQFLTFITEADVALQRPNKLRVNVSGDVPPFQLYFDGAKASVFDPQKNIHAAATQPIATIDELLEFAATKAKVNFPSSDFMYSDPYAIMTKGLTDAIIIGDVMVNGVLCEHFAYMDPAINWEIWIAKDKKALPMRLAMTYKQAPNSPRFFVEYKDWNLNPTLKASTFVFKAPANAQQLELETYQAERKAK